MTDTRDGGAGEDYYDEPVIACTQVHEHDPIDCAPESLESLEQQAQERV